MNPTASRIASAILIVLLLVVAWLVLGCASNRVDEWSHLGPPDGADTAVTVDADGNPNFGPKP